MFPQDEDTIIALSTPPGSSAIAVIRISGDKALSSVKEIFKGKIYPKKINHGMIEIEKKIKDDVLLLYFKKPHSYTGEDLIEIHTHGNMLIVESIIHQLNKKGVRTALPGEFTKRAFFNGKLDLIQAEALEKLINSSTYEGLRLSFSNLEGKLSKKVKELRNSIIEILSQLEANIDFPDYEVDVDWSLFDRTLSMISSWTEKILSSSKFSDTIFRGQNIIVAGKANVGKSSLLNAIIQEERALVSEYPGTTRDFLRERIVYKEKAFNIIDIAGIEENEKREIEEKGIKRALKIVKENENILFLVDASQEPDEKDFNVFEKIKGKRIILVLNKIDKKRKLKKEKAKKLFKGILDIVEISAKYEKNIEKLLDKVLYYFGENKREDEEIAFTQRQKELLLELKEEAGKVKEKRENGFGEEILAEHVRKMLEIIGKLTGKVHTEDILEKIFSSFCIGK